MKKVGFEKIRPIGNSIIIDEIDFNQLTKPKTHEINSKTNCNNTNACSLPCRLQ